MARIVVLGAGLGGIIAAYEAKKTARIRDKVIMVNEVDFHQFVPSNPWVLVGWRNKKDITFNIKQPLQRKGIEFVCGRATRIDPKGKELHLEDGQTVAYDYLIIATGPELAFDEIEGLGPQGGYTQSVCHIDHATDANANFETFCKKPGPVIVGAVQGASCYGPAYETLMIIETELRKRKIRDQVPMTFVTSEPYIGHLGLDGVGDTKTLLENEMRARHIKWITNAKVVKVTEDTMFVDEMNLDGSVKVSHELSMSYSMMLPAFRGVPAVREVEGLCNPRGFVVVDKHQRNPQYPDIFAVGVCIAIPPVGPTAVPVGVPKTGFMIESMVTASVLNIGELVRGKEPTHEATWNAFCIADFGDGGAMFIAQPQIPPRNVNWSAEGKWVHVAKIAFEKYFLKKLKSGKSETFFENAALGLMKIHKIKKD